MSETTSIRAGQLDQRVVGTRVVGDYDIRPNVRNNFRGTTKHVEGVVTSVRVMSIGTVRLVIDGNAVYVPLTAHLTVAAHLRAPKPEPRPVASAAPATVSRAQVMAAVDGARVGAASLRPEHVGMTVEFPFRGDTVFGELTSFSMVGGMVAVVLDGTAEFLFDEDQSFVVRAKDPSAPAATWRPEYTREDVLAAVEPAPAAEAERPRYSPPTPKVQEAAPAAWVPIPLDELEFA